VTVGDPGLGTNPGTTDFAMAILPMVVLHDAQPLDAGPAGGRDHL